MTPYEAFILAAVDAGCPRDQADAFAKANPF